LLITTDLILTILVGTNSEIRLAVRSNFGDDPYCYRNITENENRMASKLNFRQKGES